MTPIELADLERLGVDGAVKQLFESSELSKINPLAYAGKDLTKQQFRELSQFKKSAERKTRKRGTKELSVHWLLRMSETKGILREKMTLFWHGHFATLIEMPEMAQQLNNTIRKHSLGSFREMLIAVSKEPVMLQYLNNQQNKKAHPNENFARELMELFTLGIGNYTEADIKEAARAFTGWGFDQAYQFRFKQKQHDFDQKTFLGKTGNWNGEDIIDIILEQPQAAEFIATKIYKYFVNDVINETRVQELAQVFRSNNYNIKSLMQHIFEADWFYDAENVGVKIKSPVELLVGLNKQFDIEYEVKEVVHMMMRLLGQILFYPPNVAGWPGGRRWIDSSSLMLRLKVPSAILNGGIVEFEPKEDLDAMLQMSPEAQKKARTRLEKKLKTVTNWPKFEAETAKQLTIDELAEFFIQPELSDAAKNMLAGLKKSTIKDRMLELLTLPEYQLC